MVIVGYFYCLFILPIYVNHQLYQINSAFAVIDTKVMFPLFSLIRCLEETPAWTDTDHRLLCAYNHPPSTYRELWSRANRLLLSPTGDQGFIPGFKMSKSYTPYECLVYISVAATHPLCYTLLWGPSTLSEVRSVVSCDVGCRVWLVHRDGIIWSGSVVRGCVVVVVMAAEGCCGVHHGQIKVVIVGICF